MTFYASRDKLKSQIRWEAKRFGTEALNSRDHKAAWRFIKTVAFTNSKGNSNLIDVVQMNDYMASIVQPPMQADSEMAMGCDAENCFQLKPSSVEHIESILQATKNPASASHD